jgi:8-amino-7-oxononanoate synthase
LRRQLAAIPAQRRRSLRSFAPAATAATLDLATPHSRSAPLLDLASNDYLGLSRHPEVVAAAQAAAASQGLGAGASRLVSGSRPVHGELEAALAAWLGREVEVLWDMQTENLCFARTEVGFLKEGRLHHTHKK